jgi:beta-glucosidase
MTRPTRRLRYALVCLLALAPAAQAARRQSPIDRANALLAQMTRDEKIALAVSGAAGIPRLGIPGINPSDGPNGIREASPGATSFPNGVTLAASWDRKLAEEYGSALGAEASGKGFNVLLGPTINILRVPEWGRAAETFGEDPYLTGQLAAAEVRGVQSEHVIAQIKHYAANNQEILRVGNPAGSPPFSPAVDVVVSERTLREIYLPAFETAVRDGNVMSVMCAYPRVNGLYACQHPTLLTEILKNDWGFAGFVGPDAITAVRDTRAAIDAGVDNFQLSVIGAPPAQVIPQIPDARLDDMVRRILTAMFSVGLFDHPSDGDPTAVVSTPKHLELSTEIAQAGTVLLKNDGGALPLGADVRSIAVIGYDAGAGTQTQVGGSASVQGGPVVTPLTAITSRAGGNVSVTHVDGTLGVVPLTVVPSHVLGASGSTGGLDGAAFATMDWSGSPIGGFVAQPTDFNALPPGAFSVRWTGWITPPTTGDYRLSLRHAGIVRLFIQGALVATGDSEGLDYLIPGAPPVTAQATVPSLVAGVPVPITIEYSVGSAIVGSHVQFGWEPPSNAIDGAVAAASGADVAIVFANDVTYEGMDRTTLSLPGDQDGLIAAVAAVNPRTIVVLHTAAPVLMPWIDDVAAVVEAWYPGQQSGDAIAGVLFGDAEPGGRLPMTFPATASQGPVAGDLTRYPGVDGTVRYDEGLLVGYRYYDQAGQEPLFPFGHGLTYTSFDVDRPRVTRRRGRWIVSARVKNTGGRTGTAVVQLYVGFPSAANEPPQQLKGFAKVAIKARKAKRVKMILDESSFSSWSAPEGQWVVQPGEYVLQLGTSSRDLTARVSVTLP